MGNFARGRVIAAEHVAKRLQKRKARLELKQAEREAKEQKRASVAAERAARALEKANARMYRENVKRAAQEVRNRHWKSISYRKQRQLEQKLERILRRYARMQTKPAVPPLPY